MLYKRLGNSGVKVSELCLGTMTFGLNSDRPGNCDEASSHKIMDRYVSNNSVSKLQSMALASL